MNRLDEFIQLQEQIRAQYKAKTDDTVYVGMGTCGLAAGSGDVHRFLQSYLKERAPNLKLVPVGCIGLDEEEVLVDIQLAGKERYSYGRMDIDRTREVINRHGLGGKPVDKWLVGIIPEPAKPYPDLPFYRYQQRYIFCRSGFINPERIEDYIAWGGYAALVRVLTEMTPEGVIEAITQSGLRGRGGAGFPTGRKWELARRSPGEPKYVVCNADEGDPGAFMDRSLLEGDPHGVLEGLIIGAYAIGAAHGYFYVRAEYPLAIRRLKIAINQARRFGLLGDDILQTGFSFDVKIKEGAGAFVCGEETALMASIMGKRGMPHPRPPYPAEKGLWEKPTNINNTETWANVPLIIDRGVHQFCSFGNENNRGTKLFSITGKTATTGMAEVPLGMSLGTIIFKLAGGVRRGKFKAVQIGGPSGGCIPEDKLDTPVDYDALTKVGAMMGSGGMVVLNQETCMVDLARFFTSFNRNESCGKCTPCREGTVRMLEILNRLTTRGGSLEDLEKLERLGQAMRFTSLCGLGQTAPNPVLSTLTYFREEYLAHLEGRCLAGVCFGGEKERQRKEEALWVSP